jgi:hypothetical protein
MSDTPRTDAAFDAYRRGAAGLIYVQGFMEDMERENAKLRAGMTEAFKVIDVLYMDALDNHKESWPRAREWLEQWDKFKPSNQATKP